MFAESRFGNINVFTFFEDNFEKGKIDISFNERLSKDFIKNLSQKLMEWTNQRWIITLSKEKGQTTIHETKNELKLKTAEVINYMIDSRNKNSICGYKQHLFGELSPFLINEKDEIHYNIKL